MKIGIGKKKTQPVVADLIEEVQQSEAEYEPPQEQPKPRPEIDYMMLAIKHYPTIAQARGHMGTFAELPAAQQQAFARFVRLCVLDANRPK